MSGSNHASRLLLATTILSLSVCPLSAAEIRQGDTAVVKANSVWFLDAAKLGEWQALKAANDSAGLAAYQDKVLGEREAWQFSDPLEVKVLGTEPARGQVSVEMKMPGRMQGTPWFVDRGALD